MSSVSVDQDGGVIVAGAAEAPLTVRRVRRTPGWPAVSLPDGTICAGGDFTDAISVEEAEARSDFEVVTVPVG